MVALGDTIGCLDDKGSLMSALVVPLRRVRVENFRGVRALELALDPEVTVIFGGNAGGKTTILDALAVLLSEVVRLFLPEAEARQLKRRVDLRRPPVTRVDFGEQAGQERPYVYLEAHGEGVSWGVHQTRSAADRGPTGALDTSALLEALGPAILAAHQREPDALIPMFASYGTERSVVQVPLRERDFAQSVERLDALDGALQAQTQFKSVFEWFRVMQELENKRKIDLGDLDYQLPALAQVKLAMERAGLRCSNPRLELAPPRLMVDFAHADCVTEALDIVQLSDGFRTHLALIMDLARRLVQANPSDTVEAHERGINSRAVVLIDEVDLHLEATWQGEVLAGLRRAFPNTQFVVSTHSEQVIASVRADQVRRVSFEDGEIKLSPVPFAQGATSERILTELMGVPRRLDGEVKRKLDQYHALLRRGLTDQAEALALRAELEEALPGDPVFDDFDREKRKGAFLQGLVKKGAA